MRGFCRYFISPCVEVIVMEKRKVSNLSPQTLTALALLLNQDRARLTRLKDGSARRPGVASGFLIYMSPSCFNILGTPAELNLAGPTPVRWEWPLALPGLPSSLSR